MTDYDPDELLAMTIEAVADGLPGDDADVLGLPQPAEPHRVGRAPHTSTEKHRDDDDERLDRG